jgi:predicted TIM-barrel fold metal-dependent hydrolase
MSLELPFSPIDGWVNLNFASPASAGLDVSHLFPGLEERVVRGTDPDRLLQVMDDAGVERAVLTAGFNGRARDDLESLTRAVKAYPDRFVASLVVDPRAGMDTVRLVREAVEHRVRLVRMLAYETQLPYDHPAYYPVYAVCAELGIPVGLNVGLPGPRVAGLAQHPIAVDTVCAFFPGLKIVLSHGGAPWFDECAHLVLKWPELYYMTSAYAPKRVPRVILDLMNGRGADKVIWASDYPVIDLKRCVEEIAALDFKDESRRRRFARDNAYRLFFAEGRR